MRSCLRLITRGSLYTEGRFARHCRGNVSVYERDGQYQFYAVQMRPDGIGSLYLAYEQLKSKLEERACLHRAQAPLPRYPKTIGVITSPTGAAVRDIMITIRRRYPQARAILYPVLVQGKGVPFDREGDSDDE